MKQSGVWKTTHYLLVLAFTFTYFLLAFRIFVTYDDPITADTTAVNTTAVNTADTRPKLIVMSGIANDFGTTLGPWWITSSLANFQISNSTKTTFRADLSISIDLGLCRTERVVHITMQNQTKSFQLTAGHTSEETSYKFDVLPGLFYNLSVEVIGPVCQVDTDPRLFLGRLSFNRAEFVSKNEFLFK